MKIKTSYHDWEMKCSNFINRRVVFLNFCFCHEMEIGFATDHHHRSRIVAAVAIAKHGAKASRLRVFKESHLDHQIGVKVDVGEAVDYKLTLAVEITKTVSENGHVLILHIDVVSRIVIGVNAERYE